MSNSDPVTLELPSTVTIGECMGIHKQMTDALLKDNSVELNASVVEKVDAAGMQLILSFNNEAVKNNKKGDFSYSDVVIESAKLIGITEALGI